MAYTRVNWQDSPSTATPISASNLNKMDKGIKDLEDSLATVATTGDYDDLIDTPNLSTVATSGSYNDLTNKPQEHLVNIGTSVDSSYNTNLLSSKNMLKLPNIASTTTTTGLTYSVSNGVLTINGTASANTTIVLTSDLSINIPDKTAYRISVNKTGTTTATGSNLQFLLRDSSNTILGYVNNIASASQTSNSFQNAGLVNNAIFVITSGVQLTDAQFTFQVEEGTSATSYEPFTEKSIYVNDTKFTETIGVGTSVNSANRVNVLYSHNLAKETTYTNGYRLNGDGTLLSDSDYSTSDYIEVEENTTYNFNKTRTQYYNRVCFFDSNKTIISQDGGTTTTFTTPANTKYIRFGWKTTELSTLNLQIGTSIITPSIVVDNDEIYNQNIMNYSKSETRIGTWINGKPLYRKVITDTIPTTTAGVGITKTIDLPSTTNFCVVKTGFFEMYNSQIRNLPTVANSTEFISAYYIGQTKQIAIRTTLQDASGKSITLIIEYTKTTD